MNTNSQDFDSGYKSPKTFTIYSLSTYDKVFLKPDGTWNKTKSFTGNIKQVSEKILKNKGWHIRIKKDQPCVVFVDLDHCKDETIIEKFLSVLSYNFDVSIDEISYTLSKKDDEFSYHISIPSIESYPEQLKFIFSHPVFKEFRNNKQLDLSIYSDKWFRLPEQTVDIKPFTHKIINGKPEDFIISYLDHAEYNAPEHLTCPEPPIIKQVKAKEQSPDKLGQINKLMQCINPSRSHDNNEWMEIGFILKNELGDEEGKIIFESFSKLSTKYNSVEFKKIWNNIKIKSDGLKIGTLIKYAKEDNIELYNELFKEDNSINFNIEWSTGYLSDVFKSMYNDKFIYSNGILYYYNGVYWKTSDKNNSIINNFIDKEFHNDLLSKLHEFDKKTNDKNPTHILMINNKRKEIGKLRNICNRELLIKDIINKITNNYMSFDQNPFLFAFDNKIYDLKLGQFIEPDPKQYISLTTGYEINDEYNIEAKIKELNELFNTIFSQPEIKKLYLTILSTGLDGLPLEKFVLANGRGGNGKGLLNEFVQHMLGNYAYILPVNILLGQLKTGSNPELANMNNKRLVFAREPSKDLMFNCATIKEITGGTELNARVNYSNDTKVNLKLTLILECNEKPKLNEVNDALGRRILDIPFKNSFVEKYEYDELDDTDKIHTFLKNPFYKTDEFKNEYKQALFLILAGHYKEYHLNNRHLPIPKEVLQRNKDYLASSDELLNWFNDNYEKTDDKNYTIKLKKIYENFKNSDYFNNMNKLQKRQNNYKHFIEKIQGNLFLKKCIKDNGHNTYIFMNYKEKEVDDDENDSSLDL